MILRIRDANGKVQEILVIKGDKGEDGKDYVLTLVDKMEIANMVNVDIDQTYNAESENAQSGKAVAEALLTIPQGNEKQKQYELINTITVTPDTDGSLPTDVIISTDSEGNTFELTDFYINITAGFTTGSNNGLYMYLNVLNEAALMNAPVNFNNTLRKVRVIYKRLSDGWLSVSTTGSGAATTWYNNPQIGIAKEIISTPTEAEKYIPATKIRLHGLNKPTWLEGSTFELWGVRK